MILCNSVGSRIVSWDPVIRPRPLVNRREGKGSFSCTVKGEWSS